MKERIILAPGISAGELLNTLALQGRPTFNTRVMNAGELARTAVMRSGIALQAEPINHAEECAVMAHALRGIAYFDNPSWQDIQDVTAAVRRMRSLVAQGDEDTAISAALAKGIFSEKNEALLLAYRAYIAHCRGENKTDGIDVLRLAMEKAEPLQAELVTLSEFPLTPLEQALAFRLADGSVKRLSLAELFGVSDSQINIAAIHNCYGAHNETETVLDNVYRNHRLDECTVAVADPASAAQLFLDESLLRNIPVTFGCGVPITNATPAKLLELYNHWSTDGFFGAAALNEMINSPFFDRHMFYAVMAKGQEKDTVGIKEIHDFTEVLGALRLTNNAALNRRRLEQFTDSLKDDPEKDNAVHHVSLTALQAIAGELALPAGDFIARYAMLRRTSDSSTEAETFLAKLDAAALSAIRDGLRLTSEAGIDLGQEDVIRNLLSSMVCAESGRPGALHVTTIRGALAAMRRNLYISGLSAGAYPGAPRENYLLLDDDLRCFGPEAEAMTSVGLLQQRKADLDSLCRLAAGVGTSVTLSWPGLNVSELKKNNASSQIFELFRAQHGIGSTSAELNAEVEKSDYFAPAISAIREIGKAVNRGETVQPLTVDTNAAAFAAATPENGWSPSALNSFFGCPRKFMLCYLLGIPEPEETDELEIISAADGGTLAHEMMEKLANSDLTRDDFIQLSVKGFDRWLAQNPAVVTGNIASEKERFADMMGTAYDTDPHRPVVLEEEDVKATHPCGLKLRGRPDRVEQLDNGSCIIVDFKTGSRVQHVEDDIDTCLQAVVYAWLMEQRGLRIDHCEFRYLRLGETVNCRYDEEMKTKLADKLEIFRSALAAGRFNLPENCSGDSDSPCRYCKLGIICGKVENGEEE